MGASGPVRVSVSFSAAVSIDAPSPVTIGTPIILRRARHAKPRAPLFAVTRRR
jgi:hypothetical protein